MPTLRTSNLGFRFRQGCKFVIRLHVAYNAVVIHSSCLLVLDLLVLPQDARWYTFVDTTRIYLKIGIYYLNCVMKPVDKTIFLKYDLCQRQT